MEVLSLNYWATRFLCLKDVTSNWELRESHSVLLGYLGLKTADGTEGQNQTNQLTFGTLAPHQA